MQQRSKAEMGRKLWMIGSCIAVLMAVSPQTSGDTVDDWIAKLGSDTPAVRDEAIVKLGDSKDPRAIAPLIQILEPKKAPAVSGPGAAATDPAAAKVQEAKRLVGREDRAGRIRGCA